MKYTDEFLIEELQRFYEENGRSPFKLDMNIKDGYPSYTTYINHFGTFNNALIEAGLEINKISDRLDGTETCSYCEKHANEIVGFTQWLYHDGIRYCHQHGAHGIPDYVKGELDINSAKGLGRVGEICVVKTLGINKEYDYNSNNCHSNIDLYHEKYGKIDVKTRLLSIVSNNWNFTMDGGKIIDTYICLGLSSDRNKVKHVWIIPNDVKIKNLSGLGISNTYKSLLKNSKFEVDSKLYNDIFKTMKLDNCKIMINKNNNKNSR